MNLLIVEDEYPAVERLQQLLGRLDEPVEVVDVLDSVETAIRWFTEHPAPDLILSDIQLSDGLSFEIYEKLVVKSPIIFTTSYDEYAIQAFKVKSIDYLLKPIKFEELEKAIAKYKQFKSEFSEEENASKIERLLDNLQHTGRRHKKRFLVKKGEQLVPISDDEIAYFYTENELVFLFTPEGKKYVVDYTLEQLDELVDTEKFFRINRQYLVHLEAIQQIHTYFNSRLKLNLQPDPTDEVIVSKGKTKAFKQWLEG
ncbi:LytR/AlgR family response regulator transcription factor [Tunicatimonas pelagia]|uniref:LytR/AlgR family response regulator transcription factor n=1 Tax=Tunicatimonas pelagia TaxID=931531 RepID=UPI00266702FF|nr:LytTR family DNA-binding domain-containing protein [Tunicatimonas pelagia]WKN41018.1 LytTR family DNA-binding domain-containing protein [Tunicatimonas pelagia]